MNEPPFSPEMLATAAALGGVYIDKLKRIEFAPGVPAGTDGCKLASLAKLGVFDNDGTSAEFLTADDEYFYMKTHWNLVATFPRVTRPCLTHLFKNNNETFDYSLAPEFLTEAGEILPAEIEFSSYSEHVVCRYSLGPSGLPALKSPVEPGASISQLVRDKTEFFAGVVSRANPDGFPWSAEPGLQKMLAALKNLLVDKPGCMAGAAPAITRPQPDPRHALT